MRQQTVTELLAKVKHYNKNVRKGAHRHRHARTQMQTHYTTPNAAIHALRRVWFARCATEEVISRDLHCVDALLGLRDLINAHPVVVAQYLHQLADSVVDLIIGALWHTVCSTQLSTQHTRSSTAYRTPAHGTQHTTHQLHSAQHATGRKTHRITHSAVGYELTPLAAQMRRRSCGRR